jgi:ComF family protein
MGFFQSLAGFVFPHRCLGCGTLLGQIPGICVECWDGFVHVAKPFCDCCGVPLPENHLKSPLCGACLHQKPHFDKARSVFYYNDASKRLVLDLKNRDQTLLAKHMAPWLARAGRELLESGVPLIPTPLHWRRQFMRQFNQSALLAQQLGQHRDLSVIHALTRTKNSPSQGTLSPQKRAANVKNAFVADVRLLEGIETCVLIDDVLTTGATVSACAKALKKAGVRTVNVLTLCRVVKEEPTP